MTCKMEEAFHLIEVVQYGRAENSNITFRFNEHQAASCLKVNGVFDMPVAVISMTGRKSIGKSFLLNFFLKYAIHRYKNGRSDDDWLDESLTPQKGFQFKNPQRYGITLWPEVFIAEKTNGEKIALILLDTQGTFDDTSSEVSSGIFALSALASSLQIFNVFSRVDDSDLTRLESVCFFTKMVSQLEDDPLFQNILFLVRDWAEFTDNYGYEAGQAYFDERVFGGAKEPSRLKTRRNILSYFTDMSCFLMPKPGFNIPADQLYLEHEVWGTCNEFVEQLYKLVPLTLLPDNLVVKRINGEIMTVEKLFDQLKMIVHLFNTANLPAMSAMPNTTMEITLLKAKGRALSMYIHQMKSIGIESGIYADSGMFQNAHETAKEAAINLFNLAVRAGDASHASAEYRKALDVAIYRQCKLYTQKNEENNPHTTLLVLLPLLCVPVMITAVALEQKLKITLLNYVLAWTFWLSVFGLCYWCYLTYNIFVKGPARIFANIGAWLLIFSLFRNTLLRHKKRVFRTFSEYSTLKN